MTKLKLSEDEFRKGYTLNYFKGGGSNTTWINVIQESDVHIEDIDRKELSERLIKEELNNLLHLDNVSFLFGAGISFDFNGPSIGDIYNLRKNKIFKNAILNDYNIVANNKDGEEIEHKKVIKKIYNKEADKTVSLEPFIAFLENILYLYNAYDLKPKFKFQDMPQGRELDITKVKSMLDDLKKILFKEVQKVRLDNSKFVDLPSKYIKLFKVLTSRPENLGRVNIFTTNYDMLLEEAMEEAGVIYKNGFSGLVNREFSPANYNYDLYYPGETTTGKVSRVDTLINLFKIHGSISWKKVKVPINKYSTNEGNQIETYTIKEIDPFECENVPDYLIYPSPLKVGESLDYPYSELFRKFDYLLCKPQSVLFVAGYSFGDDHVNRIIQRALKIPSFHLFVIDPYAIKEDLSQMNSAFVEALVEDPRVSVFNGTLDQFIDHLPDIGGEEVYELIEKIQVNLSKLKGI